MGKKCLRKVSSYSAARAGSPSSDPPVYSFKHVELFTPITDGESPTLNLSRNACDAMQSVSRANVVKVFEKR